MEAHKQHRADVQPADEIESFLGGEGFDYADEEPQTAMDFDGGAKRRKKKRGGNEPKHLYMIIAIVIFVVAVFIIAYLLGRNSGEGFMGSGINIGGSCCKTWHTPSLTEVEYPASDGCGTCNSACNLRFTPGAESSGTEGFVSDLGSFPDQSDPSCCAQPVRVTGCAAGQLGPYEFSESHLNSMLLNGS